MALLPYRAHSDYKIFGNSSHMLYQVLIFVDQIQNQRADDPSGSSYRNVARPLAGWSKSDCDQTLQTNRNESSEEGQQSNVITPPVAAPMLLPLDSSRLAAVSLQVSLGKQKKAATNHA